MGTGLVGDLEWDDETHVVTGVVAGTHEYDTRVWLTPSTHGWRPVRSLCTCPVQLKCKHGVALLLELTAEDVEDGLVEQPDPWERQLEALLPESPRTGAAVLPVALQFDVDERGVLSGQRLQVRLATPGMRDGSWVAGDVRWRTIATAPRVSPAQRDVLAPLAQIITWAPYGASTDSWADLGTVDNPLLWHQLRAIRDAGVPLLTKRARGTVVLGPTTRIGLVARPTDGASSSTARSTSATVRGRSPAGCWARSERSACSSSTVTYSTSRRSTRRCPLRTPPHCAASPRCRCPPTPCPSCARSICPISRPSRRCAIRSSWSARSRCSALSCCAPPGTTRRPASSRSTGSGGTP
ncbi:hypothetical protein [Tsukamurella sp. PLM1]|uniref:hypothetical protein n=1 Tax=Tsukamurella sp. PLM1 TaxID=2929795 RepID=UPI0020BD898D|nr:hypothetical protein [Tsukamurella sp. PLM1]